MSEPKPDLRPEGGSPDGLGGKTWTTTRPEVATAGTSAAAWPTMAEKSELYDVPPDLLAVSPGASHATEETMAVIARQVAAREAAAEQRGAEKACGVVQVGWMGPYGLIPGGMDNDPAPHWRPVYMFRAAAVAGE